MQKLKNLKKVSYIGLGPSRSLFFLKGKNPAFMHVSRTINSYENRIERFSDLDIKI